RGGVGSVRAALGDERGGPVEALEGAGIGPPTLEDLVGQVAAPEIGVVDVGNLQLAAPRGLQGLADGEHVGVVEVDPGDRVAAGGLAGFLDDLDDPPLPGFALEAGNPE